MEGKCFPCHRILYFEIFSYPKLGQKYKNNFLQVLLQTEVCPNAESGQWTCKIFYWKWKAILKMQKITLESYSDYFNLKIQTEWMFWQLKQIFGKYLKLKKIKLKFKVDLNESASPMPSMRLHSWLHFQGPLWKHKGCKKPNCISSWGRKPRKNCLTIVTQIIKALLILALG